MWSVECGVWSVECGVMGLGFGVIERAPETLHPPEFLGLQVNVSGFRVWGWGFGVSELGIYG